MTSNGEMAVIVRYPTEFCSHVKLCLLLGLGAFWYWFLANVILTFTFAICYRPSVCRLSVTLVHPTQPVEVFGNFFTIRQLRDSSFLMPKFVGGDAPFSLKFAFKVTHPLSNSEISTNIGS